MTSDDPHTDPWAPAAAEPAPTEPGAAGSEAARPAGRGLLRVASVLFAVGVVFTILAAVTPFVLDRDAPTALYLGAMFFTPVGFLLGLASAFRGSRPPRA